jgi:hypothetical protein
VVAAGAAYLLWQRYGACVCQANRAFQPVRHWGFYRNMEHAMNYAGSSPLTKQSSKSRVVLARFVRNRRLADALTWWAFRSLSASPGARSFYDRHRAAGDTHHQALRALSNRWVGILHGCLRHRSTYSEATAWAHRQQERATAA